MITSDPSMMGEPKHGHFVRRAGSAGVVMSAAPQTAPVTAATHTTPQLPTFLEEDHMQAIFIGASDPTMSPAIPFSKPVAHMGPIMSPFAPPGGPVMPPDHHMLVSAMHPAHVGLPSHMSAMFPLTPAASPPLAFAHATPPSVPGTPIWCVRPAKISPSKPTPIPIKSKGSQNGPDPATGAAADDTDEHKDGAEQQKKPRRRRSFKELVRNIECKHEGCGRVYATESSLQTHIRLKHNSVRPQGDERALKRKPSKSSLSSTGSAGSHERRARAYSLPNTKLAALHLADTSHDAALHSMSEPCWGATVPTPDSGTDTSPSVSAFDPMGADADYLSMADVVHLDALDFSLDTDLSHLCSEVDAMISACM